MAGRITTASSIHNERKVSNYMFEQRLIKDLKEAAKWEDMKVINNISRSDYSIEDIILKVRDLNRQEQEKVRKVWGESDLSAALEFIKNRRESDNEDEEE
jgi:hypothetical protein